MLMLLMMMRVLFSRNVLFYVNMVWLYINTIPYISTSCSVHPTFAWYPNLCVLYAQLLAKALRILSYLELNLRSPVAPQNSKIFPTVGLHRQRRRHRTGCLRYPVEQPRWSPFEPTLRGRRRRDFQHLRGRRRWRQWRRRRWGWRRGR